MKRIVSLLAKTNFLKWSDRFPFLEKLSSEVTSYLEDQYFSSGDNDDYSEFYSEVSYTPCGLRWSDCYECGVSAACSKGGWYDD